MSKKELKVKTKGGLEEAISYLKALTSSLKEKKLVIQKESSFITLSPKDEVSLEIEAEQKREKENLSIKLSWKNEDVILQSPEANLIISSKEPKMKEEVPGEKKEEKKPVIPNKPGINNPLKK